MPVRRSFSEVGSFSGLPALLNACPMKCLPRYSACQKNVPAFKRFFLQPLMPQFRNSEHYYGKRYKRLPYEIRSEFHWGEARLSGVKAISSGLPCNPIEDGIQPGSWHGLFPVFLCLMRLFLKCPNVTNFIFRHFFLFSNLT